MLKKRLFLLQGWLSKHPAIAKGAEFLLTALVFSLAYTQEAIFNSPENADGNQNTKYFLGLARAGYGFLERDWLASTIDALPAFTALVEWSYRLFQSEIIFFIDYGLILGLYVFSLVGIVNYLYPLRNSRSRYLAYLGLFIFIHTVNLEIGRLDTGWDLHAGVAKQYLLGPVFQPCNFGVFLLTSIWAFLYGRWVLAVVGVAIAATVHPAYLVSSGVLILAYMTDIIESEKNFRKAVFLGLLAGFLILPVFSYMQFTFTATTPELKQKAYDILVNYRIPLHSLPEIWLGKGGAKVQCALPLVALILVRKTRLFLLILVPYIFAVVLTILQIFIHNDFLAFIAPWRMSVFLVPLSTAVILGWFVCHLLTQNQDSIWMKRLVTGLSLLTISVLVVVGAGKQLELFNYEGESTPMLEFVRLNKQPEDLYLIPPDYKDLQKFRLYTGAPIFINRKSHPYKDIEVIAWYNRVETALSIYQNNDCSRLQEIISEAKITHTVAQNEQYPLNCKFLEAIYQDKLYKVYKIQAIAADS